MAADSTVDKGESARFSSFMGAIAIADLVKTTLGPKGMDKILQVRRAAVGALRGCRRGRASAAILLLRAPPAACR